jgi:hypothetical protein
MGMFKKIKAIYKMNKQQKKIRENLKNGMYILQVNSPFVKGVLKEFLHVKDGKTLRTHCVGHATRFGLAETKRHLKEHGVKLKAILCT